MTRTALARIIFAAVSAPAVPVAGLYFAICQNPSGTGCLSLMTWITYGCFIVLGIPTLPIAISKRTWQVCAALGSAVAIAPVLLVSAMANFATLPSMDRDGMTLYASLVAFGAGGGLVFWAIAFLGAGGLGAHDSLPIDTASHNEGGGH